jgi:hypothetical protein
MSMRIDKVMIRQRILLPDRMISVNYITAIFALQDSPMIKSAIFR